MLSWSSSLTLLRLPFPHTSAVSVTATFPSSYNHLAYLHPFLFPVRALRQDLQWKKGCWTSFAGKSRSSFSASPSWKSLPVLTCDTSQPFEYFRNLEDISEMRLLGCWGVFCGFLFVCFVFKSKQRNFFNLVVQFTLFCVSYLLLSRTTPCYPHLNSPHGSARAGPRRNTRLALCRETWGKRSRFLLLVGALRSFSEPLSAYNIGSCRVDTATSDSHGPRRIAAKSAP